MQTHLGIAMSGGVDSTATALMLKETYGADNLRGYFMRLAQPDFAQQLARVQEVAERVGVALEVIDLTAGFEREVLTYFADSYFDGLTPNPCVVCNRRIKFGLFLEAMTAAGADQVATGHYARLVRDNGATRLLKGIDKRKDQSYFLSRLTQAQLNRLLFPLGELEKSAIYDFVESHGFTDFRGRESQDVCFLENTAVGDFLAVRGRAATPGAIVDVEGNTLGEHQGVHRYTVGQRKGLGISSPAPLYVVALDTAGNRVIVGGSEALLQQEIPLHSLHWLHGVEEGELTVKIRYTHAGATARLTPQEEERALLTFAEPQRAVTPGQYAVFYRDDEVLGSGIIDRSRP